MILALHGTLRIRRRHLRPWRAFEIREGHTFESREGKLAVHLPDIDLLDVPSALRTDINFETRYPHVESA